MVGSRKGRVSSNHWECCEAIDRKLMGAFMDNRLGWGAFMGSRASSLFALVRGCKDSSGLREFGFGRRISLLALVLILVIPHSASAQATATLNGVVRDSSSAVIPQATVILQNTDTGTERESLTNDSGLYVFVSVQPGEYVLKVTKEGFTTATQGLHVLVNQASTLDFTLKVGSTQQSVTVEASAVNLETGNATLGSVIESKQVRDLPLNGRNFTQLLALTPGVSPVSVAQNSGGAQAAPLGSFVFPSVSGQSNRSNYFLLDGIDNTDQVFTTYAVAPILDDIQEFKVQSHSDEAQFGGVLGGIVNVVSKSGTNNFHGTAWEFFRNTVLDAKNPLKSGAGGASKLVQNQFGANFGGPVILPFYNGRNKTFFFGSYEGFRRAQPSSSVQPPNSRLALAARFTMCPQQQNFQATSAHCCKVLTPSSFTTRSRRGPTLPIPGHLSAIPFRTMTFRAY